MPCFEVIVTFLLAIPTLHFPASVIVLFGSVYKNMYSHCIQTSFLFNNVFNKIISSNSKTTCSERITSKEVYRSP